MKKYFLTFIFLTYSFLVFLEFIYYVNFTNKAIGLSNIENLELGNILKLQLVYTITKLPHLLNSNHSILNINQLNIVEYKNLVIINR